MWSVEAISGLEGDEIKNRLDELSRNELAAIRIPDIYTDDELRVIINNIDEQGILWYPNFELKQGRIGICATEYFSKPDGKEQYFGLEAEHSAVRHQIFPGNLDPVERMTEIFSRAHNTAVAKEPSLDDASYFTGLIRAMAQESTTHFDFAPHQLPGWRVADTQSQFAVIIYLQMPDDGGGLTVYNRPWRIEDDEFNNDTAEKGPYGFERGFLDGEEWVTILPSAGEMLVINSKNFHRVECITSQLARYSVNSFMSLSEDELLLWN